MAAMLALMGLPPFGLFMSEVLIFGRGLRRRPRGGRARSPFSLLAFGGLLPPASGCWTGPDRPRRPCARSTWVSIAPAALALGLLVLTGLAWPPGLALTLDRIVAVVGR